jgi:hypothetical protein
MNPDNPITPAYRTAPEVERLFESWQRSNRESARRFDAYNTAKAANEAANDTGRILDEAIDARDAAQAAHTKAWLAVQPLRVAVAEIRAQLQAAININAEASNTHSAASTAVLAARKAHEATR